MGLKNVAIAVGWSFMVHIVQKTKQNYKLTYKHTHTQTSMMVFLLLIP